MVKNLTFRILVCNVIAGMVGFGTFWMAIEWSRISIIPALFFALFEATLCLSFLFLAMGAFNEQ